MDGDPLSHISYQSEVEPLAIRLGESLRSLAETPEKAGNIYQHWGNKQNFQDTLFTYMVIEDGLDPDGMHPDRIISLLDKYAEGFTNRGESDTIAG